MEDKDFWLNRVIKNNYLIIKYLGNGGYSNVYLCFDIKKNTFIALKIFNLEDYDYGLIEYNKNKYICNKVDDNKYLLKYLKKDIILINKEKILVIFMEIMSIGSLYSIITSKSFTSYHGFLIFIKYIKHVLKGLNELHKNNIIHGDIKPENMLLGKESKSKNILDIKFKLKTLKAKNIFLSKIKEKNNKRDIKKITKYFSKKLNKYYTKHNDNDLYENLELKLSDFGDSIIDNNNNKIYNIQTDYYKSPEDILKIETNTKSDIWALGCSIYEIITGKILFNCYNKEKHDNIRKHLYLIETIIDVIPESLIIKSPLKTLYFTNQNTVKGFSKYKNKKKIEKNIYNSLKDKVDNNIIILLTDFIKNLINTNIEQRYNINDALNHKLINLY